jgi:hypothetical protein
MDDDTDHNRTTAPRRPPGWMGWWVSAGVHGLTLTILGVVVTAVAPRPTDPPPVVVARILASPPEPSAPTIHDRTAPVLIPIEAPAVDAEAPDMPAIAPPEPEASSEDDAADTGAAGRADAMSDVENGGAVAAFAIGASGGAGMRGLSGRSHRRKHLRLGAGGPPPGSEPAVERGLQWLKRHQSPDGTWDAVGYQRNCDDAVRCEPGRQATGDTTAALTGYGVLCYLGTGYDHRAQNRYRTTIRRGIDALLASQDSDGGWGRNYENGVCALALVEAYGMTGDTALREPAQRALDRIRQLQARDGGGSRGGLGWTYVQADPRRNDSSVTGWTVMALKAGLGAGLEVADALDGARRWLDQAWRAANGDAATVDPDTGVTVFPYTWDATTGATKGNHLACVGLAVSSFLQGSDARMTGSLANWVLAHQTPRTWAEVNTYATYYNAMGLFQVGGQRWETWNRTVPPVLVAAQRQDPGCFDGSWDWQGATPWHGHEVGRVLATCYMILCLEVYYRAEQIARQLPKVRR